MSASRVVASTYGRDQVSVHRGRKPRGPGANKVLAERNQAVVAVGAWVENGADFSEHPSALASLTEELQAERRRDNEESLRRFQDEVRHRVAQRTQIFKKRQQPQVKPDRIPQQRYYQPVLAGEKATFEGATVRQVIEGNSHECSEGMRQVRLRLAACQMTPHGEVMTNLPGGKWNISPTSQKVTSHRLRAEQDMEEEDDLHGEEEEDEGDSQFFSCPHECPLVEQKVVGCVWDTEKSHPALKPSFRDPQILWPLYDQDELKRQRQSQFLMHRRHFMNMEREQVKENKQNRKHLKRTARIKAEREQIRLEEERKLERVQQLADARQKLAERELLIQQRLKLEEDERAAELQKRKKVEKGKIATRFIEGLRAQMKERLSQEKLELPPLCCCASSFWDSHPDTCANNCVFHNNPKAYAQALHSTMLNLDLR
ncbi:coiled-coil domain-containing protein 15 [Echeneis naucrates]|uniref:Coiled-coil domain containing 15 n=1 Tax=Echeneis naucrates TaxID=173247 RepID=A0A665XCB6_ECHNA|nr:coiled-coil domain-containing protein 15 [Echeneis naucrates]